MARNDFLGFATGDGANILTQEEYAARPEVLTGMTSGPAESKTCNKVWAQGANMAAALGEFIKAQGYDALDDGDIETLSAALAAALAKLIPALATHTSNGLMSAADKVKIDAVHGVTAYSRTADYAIGDLVTYQGELYIAQAASGPSSGGPSVPNGNSNATWAPIWHVTANAAPNGRTGFMTADDKTKLNSFYGILPYDRTHTYAPGYVVYYLGSIYACIQMHTSSDPHAPTDTAYWQKVITAPMTGASSSAAGAAGLVPAPAAGDNGSFLRGDGQWIDPAGILPPPNIPMYYSTDDYVLNDIVTSGGAIFLALQDNGPGTPNGVHGLTESAYWAPFVPGDAIVDITISGSTMTLTHASGSTATRTLPVYDNADTSSY